MSSSSNNSNNNNDNNNNNTNNRSGTASGLSIGATMRMSSVLNAKANGDEKALSHRTDGTNGAQQGRRYSFNQISGEAKWRTNTLSNPGLSASTAAITFVSKLRRKAREAKTAKTSATPKDKFVVTVTVLVYLIFPTLCEQAFQMFDCKTIAGVRYLAVDLEHPCYTGGHLMAVLTLGVGQLALFVAGLPLLVLFFLRRNRKLKGGLNRHRIKVRYGLFFSAYDDTSYFWEVILTARKVSIVALSVFGRSIGTQRQAQVALLILFACIMLEITGIPYRIVTERHKVLSRLELASLFSLFMTMWCGTLIFASQAPGDEWFVIFLTLAVAIINVCILFWLFTQLIAECMFEHKSSNIVEVVRQRMKSTHKSGLAPSPNVSETQSAPSDGSERDSERAAGTRDARVELTAINAVTDALDSATPASLKLAHSKTTRQEQKPICAGTNPLLSAPVGSWTREFDETSSRFYLHNKGTGESKWAEADETGEPVQRKHRYSVFETDAGDTYFVPESGDGETLWDLPEGAEVVQ